MSRMGAAGIGHARPGADLLQEAPAALGHGRHPAVIGCRDQLGQGRALDHQDPIAGARRRPPPGPARSSRRRRRSDRSARRAICARLNAPPPAARSARSAQRMGVRPQSGHRVRRGGIERRLRAASPMLARALLVSMHVMVPRHRARAICAQASHPRAWRVGAAARFDVRWRVSSCSLARAPRRDPARSARPTDARKGRPFRAFFACPACALAIVRSRPLPHSDGGREDGSAQAIREKPDGEHGRSRRGQQSGGEADGTSICSRPISPRCGASSRAWCRRSRGWARTPSPPPSASRARRSTDSPPEAGSAGRRGRQRRQGPARRAGDAASAPSRWPRSASRSRSGCCSAACDGEPAAAAAAAAADPAQAAAGGAAGGPPSRAARWRCGRLVLMAVVLLAGRGVFAVAAAYMALAEALSPPAARRDRGAGPCCLAGLEAASCSRSTAPPRRGAPRRRASRDGSAGAACRRPAADRRQAAAERPAAAAAGAVVALLSRRARRSRPMAAARPPRSRRCGPGAGRAR